MCYSRCQLCHRLDSCEFLRVRHDQQRRHLCEGAQALLEISEIVVAPGRTPEQVMRVAPDSAVGHRSPIGLLLLEGKVLLRFFGNGLERVLQEKVEIDAQEAKQELVQPEQRVGGSGLFHHVAEYLEVL